MSDCKTFHGVTDAIFDCVKKTSQQQHETVYDPATGNQGKATTKTIVGTVVVSFDLDSAADAITYCIVSKPLLAPAHLIFNGISDTINGCRKK